MSKEIITQSETNLSNDGRGGRATDVITDAQRAFVENYISNGFVATKAAIAAGYHAKHGTRLIRQAKVRALIDERLADLVLTANEVLVALSEHARGDYAQYIRENGDVDIEGMVRDNKAHLIKEIRETRLGTTYKFHDPQVALQMLAKHYSLTGSDTRVEVNQVSFSTIEIRLSDNEPQPMIVEGEIEE